MDIYKHYINPGANNRQMVRVGRLVAITAMIIAISFAPQLRNLDQVFQYIQEYTGFIYPGVVVVFTMGLFWNQISSKGAIWTAAVTIPIGIAMKAALPEIPWILRMGYVFIILCMIASIISYFDKGVKVKAPEVNGGVQKKLINSSYIMAALSFVCFVLGILFSGKYASLGFESIIVLASIFLMLAIIAYTNAKIDIQDKKAFHNEATLFKTGVGFNVGAIGIVGIVAFLYIVFWM